MEARSAEVKGEVPRWGRKRRRAVLFLACFLFWIVVLGMEWWLKMPVSIPWGVELQDAAPREVKSHQNQWILQLFFTFYALTFLWLPLRAGRARRGCVSDPPSRNADYALPIVGAVFLAVLGCQYWRDPESVAAEGSALVLLTGLMMGMGFRFLGNQAGDGFRAQLIGATLSSLAVFLALVALWQPDHAFDYHYRERERWTGLWENPNRYGLLMGVGFLISMGRWGAVALGAHRPWKRAALAWWWGLGVVCGFGLFQSLSRGAWLGSALGSLLLMARFWGAWKAGRERGHHDSRGSLCRFDERTGMSALPPSTFAAIVGGLHRNRAAYATILVSFFIIVFWTFRHSEVPAVRRVLSVANVNDFSWRNRVAAYEGALRMMSDRPVAGHGWGSLRDQYGAFYSRPRIAEPAAITLNDFLSLGAMLGLPALVAFLAVLVLLLGRRRADGDSVEAWIAVSAVIVLLTGFWFDDGLFHLALGTPFWVLLAIVSLSGAGSRAFVLPSKRLALVGAAGFVCLLVWADVRDPHCRVRFKAPDSGPMRAEGVALLPKPVGTRPTIVYLHGSRGNVVKDGPTLRAFAELGFNAVSLDYDQSETGAFEAEFEGLLAWLEDQAWFCGETTAWVGSSLGAQKSLSFLLRRPERQPRLYVRIGGGLVDGLAARDGDVLASAGSFSCPTLLVHGEEDRVFPAADCEVLGALLKSRGVPVETKILSGQEHGFRPEREVVLRVVGEYVAGALAGSSPEEQDEPERRRFPWGATAIALVVSAAGLARRFWSQHQVKAGECSVVDRRLCRAAWCAAGLATAVSVVHLSAPALNARLVSPDLVARLLPSPGARDDFREIAARADFASTRFGNLLEHAELANYRGPFLYGGALDREIWSRYIVSPLIGESEPRAIDWRRPLWEHFYPRVRQETDPGEAARIVVRHLRARVGIHPGEADTDSLGSAWERGLANTRDWEWLYVAALRSAGVAARIGEGRRAAIWDGGRWVSAPRPLIDLWSPGGQ